MGFDNMEKIADLIIKALNGENMRKEVEGIALNLRMRYWKGYA